MGPPRRRQPPSLLWLRAPLSRPRRSLLTQTKAASGFLRSPLWALASRLALPLSVPVSVRASHLAAALTASADSQRSPTIWGCVASVLGLHGVAYDLRPRHRAGAALCQPAHQVSSSPALVSSWRPEGFLTSAFQFRKPESCSRA